MKTTTTILLAILLFSCSDSSLEERMVGTVWIFENGDNRNYIRILSDTRLERQEEFSGNLYPARTYDYVIKANYLQIFSPSGSGSVYEQLEISEDMNTMVGDFDRIYYRQ